MLDKCKDHLSHVDESYRQHLCFAVRFGMEMIAGGVAAILHGICPAVFQTSGSRTLEALHAEIEARRAAQIKPE